MRFSKQSMTRLLFTGVLGSGIITPAGAQTTSSGAPAPQADQSETSTGLQDIIVTAQRRQETAQSTPIAISAFDGAKLASKGINAVEGLNTLVPNLNFARYSGIAQIAIRGVAFDVINPGAEGRVAVHNDGVYISRPSAAIANFFDIDRIEVLRGPQGTLYGRNATAGAINIISRDPTDTLQGYGRLTVGNYALVQTEGAVSGPLATGISARLAFQTTDHNGYGKNIATNEDIDDEQSRAVRGKLLIEPSDSFSLKITGDYNYRDDASAGRHDFGQGRPDRTPRGLQIGATRPSNLRDTAGYQPHYHRELYGFAGEATYRASDAVTLISLTGYRDTLVDINTNIEGTTAKLGPQHLREHAHQFSQEARAQIDLERVKLILGGYYFNETINGITHTRLDGNALLPGPCCIPLGTPGVLYYGADFGGRLRTKALAAFGQADIDILPTLQLSVGARYSHETKNVDEYSVFNLTTPSPLSAGDSSFPLTSKRASFSSFDPKVTLTYKPDRNLMAYATFSQGFKSGGFALGAMLPAFRPEKLRDYEVGIKSDLLDHHLRANLSAFYYDYKNLQVTKVNGTVVTTENAANAVVKGVEAELRALPAEGLDIGLNVSVLRAKFKDYVTTEPARPALGNQDLTGNTIAQSPRHIVTVDAGYSIPLGQNQLALRGDVTWKDRIYFSAYNRPEISQAPYAIANASLTLRTPSRWEVTLFVRNLTDKLYRVSSVVGASFMGYPIGGQVGDPRTFGLTVGKQF